MNPQGDHFDLDCPNCATRYHVTSTTTFSTSPEGGWKDDA